MDTILKVCMTTHPSGGRLAQIASEDGQINTQIMVTPELRQQMAGAFVKYFHARVEGQQISLGRR